jgi:raffinose/stachyose/melibiose transport system substrate-binding protein
MSHTPSRTRRSSLHSPIARRSMLTGLGVAGAATALAACAPGTGPGSSKPDDAKSTAPVSKDVGDEDVTLTVWDQNTDGGIAKAQEDLNNAFMKKYPNVKIERTSRSFNDLKTTLKLALSGDTPPHVIQANQGYPDMDAFVKAGYLRPMDDYADLYGWKKYYPESLLKLNSFSSDGKTWQGDTLYGVSQTGELVGLYYNHDILGKIGLDQAPSTLDELTAAFGKAKDAGILPLSFGNNDKSPGIQLYGVALSALTSRDYVNKLVTSASGSWTDDEPVKAATVLKEWQDKGYLTPGSGGVSRDAAVATFAKGDAAFAITGTWYQQNMEEGKVGKSIGFTALTPDGAKSPVTTGGEGLSWAITSKAEKPDVAAAYIDFITDTAASKELVETNNLPTVVPDGSEPSSQVGKDIFEHYKTISQANGLTPYLDYTTPTFYDTLSAGVQDLIAGKAIPEEFTKKLQDDTDKFLEAR